MSSPRLPHDLKDGCVYHPCCNSCPFPNGCKYNRHKEQKEALILKLKAQKNKQVTSGRT